MCKWGLLYMSDLRNKRMKLLIYQSFSELLQNEPFAKITIDEIAKKALIHRNTFYNHFSDKYDLLENFIAYYFPEDIIIDHFDEFKQHPFSFLEDNFNADIIKIAKYQEDDHDFSDKFANIMLKLFYQMNNDDVIWMVGRLFSVMSWSSLNGIKDNQVLDEIYITGHFPNYKK